MPINRLYYTEKYKKAMFSPKESTSSLKDIPVDVNKKIEFGKPDSKKTRVLFERLAMSGQIDCGVSGKKEKGVSILLLMSAVSVIFLLWILI